MPSTPGSMEPFVQQGNSNWWTPRRAMYVPLFDASPGGKFAPVLATSWKAEGTTWTMKTREDARFSDGSPFTAEDIKLSVETLGNPANKYLTSIGSFTKSIRVVDATTVVFETPQPDAIYPARLALTPIVSAKAWARLGPEGYAANPVSIGPYRLKSFTANQSLVVEPDPNFWSPGTIATLTFQALPDEGARLAALKAGTIQVATSLTAEPAASAKASGKTVMAFQAAAIAVIQTSYDNARSPAVLKDIRVRRAIALATDRAGLVKAIGAEWAVPLWQMAAPDDTGYNPDLRPIPYDPAQAKQLIQQAGAQGAKLTLEFPTGNSPYIGNIAAQALADGMNNAGLDVTIAPQDSATFSRSVQTATGSNLKLNSLQDRSFDASANMPTWVGPPGPFNPETAWYASAEFRDLLAKSTAELDYDKRAPLVRQMVKVFYDDIPGIPYAQIQNLYAVDPTVTGLKVIDNIPDFIPLGIRR